MNNDNLREALPFLRPRIEDPSWYVLLIFGVLSAAFLGLILYHVFKGIKQRRQRYQQLVDGSADRGLSAANQQFLTRLAQKSKLPKPIQLISSTYAFDRAIAPIVRQLMEENWKHRDIDKIESIREKLGFDHIPADQPLRTTRQLQEGLTIMVWCEGENTDPTFYPWVLIHRDDRAFTLVPLVKNDYHLYGPLHPEQILTLRFWREADTEYRFTSAIAKLNSETFTVILHHCERLERLQQRDFYRIDVHFEIALYVLQEIKMDSDSAQPNIPEKQPEEGAPPPFIMPLDESQTDLPRFNATVLDLSAGGLSIETTTTLPLQNYLQITPNVTGPFPLAGLYCQIVKQVAVGDALRLQLSFISLPPGREAELVREVYQHQLRKTNSSAAD